MGEKEIGEMRMEMPTKMKEVNAKHLKIEGERVKSFKEQHGKQDERNAKLDKAGLKHSAEEAGHDEAQKKMEKEKKEKDDRAAAHKAELAKVVKAKAKKLAEEEAEKAEKAAEKAQAKKQAEEDK